MSILQKIEERKTINTKRMYAAHMYVNIFIVMRKIINDVERDSE